MAQILKVDQTGRLYFEFESRPSAAALSILKADGTDLTTPVTDVDIHEDLTSPDVATTLSDDAAQDAAVLELTSVDNILPNYDFWIDGGTRNAEQVRVQSVDTDAKTVGLARPLAGQHLSGATFERNVLYYDVDDENNDDVYTDNVARVTVTRLFDGDEQEEVVDFLYNVRYTIFRPTLTAAKILQHDSNMANWGGQRAKGFDDDIAAGLEELQEYLVSRNYDLNNLKDCSRAETAHRKATVYKIISNWSRGNPDRASEVDRARVDFERAADTLINSGAWYERTQDDVKTNDESERYDEEALIWA